MTDFVLVQPKDKKSFIEVTKYQKGDNIISVETVYRWGEVYVRKDLLPEDSDEELDVNSMEGGMVEFFDVCEEEFVPYQNNEETEKFIELYQEDPWTVEDELEWEMIDSNWYIENGFEVIGDYEE